MVGVGALVTGAAPLAGGVLLGGMAGELGPSAPDLRAVILSDLELLQRIPEAEVARRAALKRMLGEHVEALLVAQEKSREFRRKTRYFTEHCATSCCLSRPCCSSSLFAMPTTIVRFGFRC